MRGAPLAPMSSIPLVSVRALRAIVILSLASTLAPGALARTSGDDGPKRDRETLQQLLERLKKLRDGAQGELANAVDPLLAAFDSDAQVRRIQGLEATRDKLIALGSEVVPRVLPLIDPGSAGGDAEKLRARFATDVLVALPTRAITDKLVDVVRGGTLDGKRNALRVLAVTPEPERVSSMLAQFFRSVQGPVREDVLVTLVRIGGPENEKVLSESLADPNPEIVRFALHALADVKAAALAPRVQKLIANRREAAQYVDALLGYYGSVPAAIEKPVVEGFLALAQDFSLSRDVRARILAALAGWGDKFDSKLKTEVRRMAASPERETKEGALILLYQIGDKSARKELLADYDEQIERNKNWATTYEQRATVLYRMGEWRDAEKDYRQAITLGNKDVRAQLDQSYIGLARCQAQQNKLKDAVKTLESAPVSLKQLNELARDPAFAKLVENPKFRDVFKLE